LWLARSLSLTLFVVLNYFLMASVDAAGAIALPGGRIYVPPPRDRFFSRPRPRSTPLPGQPVVSLRALAQQRRWLPLERQRDAARLVPRRQKGEAWFAERHGKVTGSTLSKFLGWAFGGDVLATILGARDDVWRAMTMTHAEARALGVGGLSFRDLRDEAKGRERLEWGNDHEDDALATLLYYRPSLAVRECVLQDVLDLAPPEHTPGSGESKRKRCADESEAPDAPLPPSAKRTAVAVAGAVTVIATTPLAQDAASRPVASSKDAVNETAAVAGAKRARSDDGDDASDDADDGSYAEAERAAKRARQAPEPAVPTERAIFGDSQDGGGVVMDGTFSEDGVPRGMPISCEFKCRYGDRDPDGKMPTHPHDYYIPQSLMHTAAERSQRTYFGVWTPSKMRIWAVPPCPALLARIGAYICALLEDDEWTHDTDKLLAEAAFLRRECARYARDHCPELQGSPFVSCFAERDGEGRIITH